MRGDDDPISSLKGYVCMYVYREAARKFIATFTRRRERSRATFERASAHFFFGNRDYSKHFNVPRVALVLGIDVP